MTIKTKSSQRGFTLVEIMIVVLIIAILLAIAVPNFITARANAQKKSCIANLRQINSAKEQWAMDNNATNGSAIPGGLPTLVGSTEFLKSTPSCPGGGTYTLGNIGADPTCTLAAQGHVL